MSEETPAKPTYEELLDQLAEAKQQLASRLERAQEKDAALRQREERHRLALEAGAMATWDWHVPSGEVVWNDEHFRMLGYEPGSIAPGYQAWAARVHPEDRDATETLVRANVEKGGEYRSEFRALFADGTVRWIEARGRTERGAAGEPLRQYGVMLDITERKRAEEEQRHVAGELANRVGELQAILDHAPIAIWIAHDPECRKITGNAFADQVSGDALP
jgi:PAS domain S-box-containing protein